MRTTYGSLVPCTTGGYMVLPPKSCPNGHPLGPNMVLVGHQPCGCGGGGHMSWECRECNGVIYAPPTGSACLMLDGAAFRR